MYKNIISLSILFLILFSTQRASAAWDPAHPGDCSFACKEIPDDAHVLKSLGEASQAELLTESLSVLVWNVHKGKDPKFAENFVALSSGKDLVLLSEAVLDGQMESSLLAQPGWGWMMATSFITKDQGPTGTMIGSAAQAEKIRFKRTEDLEPFVKAPKAIALAEFRLPGKAETLLVLSIHGINWSGDEGLERQLQAILPELKSHLGPIVFAGDFNFKNPNRLALATRILGQAGLKRVSWSSPVSKKQLDDAFTRDVKVHRAELIRSVVPDASDHPALVLEFSVESNEN